MPVLLASVLLAAGAYAQPPAAEPAVAVVLGAGSAPEGWANPILAERVCRGVAEYKKGQVKKLLMSGGYTTGHIAEAEMMRALAVAMGAAAADVLLERSSVNTAENAAYATIVARKHKLRRGVLVTHQGHIARAHREFDRFGEGWWQGLEEAEADGNLSTGCFRAPPALPAALAGTAADMLIVDVTEERSFADIAASEADVPTPALVDAASFAAAAYREGKAKRVYFALPEPSTSTASTGLGSAHGHISRTELARLLASSMGVAWDDLFISSGRRLGEVSGAVEPAADPWLRIPKARLVVRAPASRREWWRAKLRQGLNAMLPPAEFLE